MKIIEMERMTLSGEPVEYNPVYENGEDFREYWCVLENETEEKLYEETWNSNDTDLIPTWNKMINEAGRQYNLCWGDDEIYGYVHTSETAPMPTEPFIDGDGDEWRVIQ